MLQEQKKKIILPAILIFTAIGLGILIYFDNYVNKAKIRETFGYTADEVAECGYFELWMPSDENKDLPCDLSSTCFGDEYVWFFMPNGIDTKKSVIYAKDGDGNLLSRFVIDLDEDFMIGSYHVKKTTAVLPVMYLSLENHSKFEEMNDSLSKDIVCYGDMKIYVDPESAKQKGWYTEYVSRENNSQSAGTVSIKGRGHLTWEYGYKKGYSLKLEKKMSILGMKSREEWNLIGNPFDVSLLKNDVFNDLASNLGIKYQPEMEPVDLYVDGGYRGVYFITSKVEAGKRDIPLSDGDYLYLLTDPDGENAYYFDASSWNDDEKPRAYVTIKYPKYATEEQINEGGRIFQRFISAIEDTESDEFLKYMDLDEMVNYYWIQEASMNYDGFERNVFFYYDHTDGKIHVGPVWDMDLTLGSPWDKDGIWFDSPKGWKMRRKSFYRSLFKHPEFADAVEYAYCYGGVREALYDSVEDFYTKKKEMGYDAELNYTLQSGQNPGYTYDYGGDNYDEYCENMISFYKKRLKWIDKYMAE